MKHLNRFFLLTLIASLIGFTACSDDDEETPSTSGGSLEISITGLPSGTDANILVEGPSNYETTVTAETTLSDLAAGDYTLTINAVDASDSRYVGSESEITVTVGMSASSEVVNYVEFSTVNGIQGTWVSAGADVAPILVTLFSVDSIVAVFNSNQTYEVLQYAGGAISPITLSGTYTQTLSSEGAIWTITVDQTSPAALTSEGIFEVDASTNPDGMQYEIVQTSPDIGATPPTPADGFGSSSGGAFGDTNIQNYKRRSY